MSVEALASSITASAAWDPTVFGIAFVGGLVAGLGPCVLPMIPAVFGYVTGAVAETDEPSPALRGLALSAVFVLGMSLVFAAIGAVAGLVGRALIVAPWAYYVAAGVFAVLGLQMLGVVRLPLDALQRFVPQRQPQRRGFFGALVLGMLMGAVASPCSTPILAAIAAIAATTSSAGKGAALLFVYGVGKGTPLLALGIASGSLGLMRSMSRMTSLLTRLGGVGMMATAAYLVWLA